MRARVSRPGLWRAPPMPWVSSASYVKTLVDHQVAGDVGNYEVIDANRAVASGASTRGTWADAGITGDDLHPDVYSANGARAIAANFRAQRPDFYQT